MTVTRVDVNGKTYILGKKNVTNIEYHAPVAENDIYYVDITFNHEKKCRYFSGISFVVWEERIPDEIQKLLLTR